MNDPTGLTDLRAASPNVILTADHQGVVLEIAEGPEELRERLSSGLSAKDIWDEHAEAVVLHGIKRALRGRTAHSAADDSGQVGIEFVFVPQGRDRVLVIAREDGIHAPRVSRDGRPEMLDSGTGLPNRALLLEELEQIAVTQRLKEGRAAVLCLYVELPESGFGALGVGKEDELLTKLAARLGGQLRGMNDEDPVDYERYSVLARTDYRQFVVVLPEIETGEAAEAVLCRLIESLQQPVTVGTRSTMASVSGGLALLPQDGTDAQTLLDNATAAMADARASEGTSYRFHSGTVRLRSLQRQDVAADLKTALSNEAFEIRFMPVVSATSGKPRSAEALLRWPETALGAVSTQKIVTTAEHTGVIIEIGDWVTRKALEASRSWHQKGHHAMRVSINLSGQEFASPGLVSRVADALRDTGADPTSVEFELKEHMVARDATRNFATIRALKELGINLLLDDYGTGACTLADLSRCPLDAIKIDLSLVARIETDVRDRAACAAAIGMAHGLGMRVVAEGVETEAQATYLREAGCDELQGFLFAVPLSDKELMRLLDGEGGERTLIA